MTNINTQGRGGQTFLHKEFTIRIYVRQRLQGQKALDKVVGGLVDAWLDIGDCQDLHKTVV